VPYSTSSKKTPIIRPRNQTDQPENALDLTAFKPVFENFKRLTWLWSGSSSFICEKTTTNGYLTSS
jgi:hypothetical protein